MTKLIRGFRANPSFPRGIEFLFTEMGTYSEEVGDLAMDEDGTLRIVNIRDRTLDEDRENWVRFPFKIG